MNERIIKKPDVLSIDYLPDKLLHREKEFQHLKNNIENSVNTIVVGPVGSGKTALAKRIIKDLAAEDIRYVDCFVFDTAFSILREIMPSAKLSVQRSIYQLIKRLTREAKEAKLWICFDNFVSLKDPKIITKVMKVGVNVILISNVKQNAELLNLNALSRIPCIIKLPTYTSEKSFDILKARALEALVNSSYTDQILMEITEKTKGNITLAINVLRTAALNAQSKNKNCIEIQDLIETPYVPDASEDLSKDEKALLEILREKRQLPSGELFELYKQRTNHPKGERMFRNYMERLCENGKVKPVGEKKGRIYEIVQTENNE
jgi:Cdc6-like AAA superfamily ATPase